MYSKMQWARFPATAIWVHRTPSASIRISSPGLTSRRNFAFRASAATLSDATMYPFSVFADAERLDAQRVAECVDDPVDHHHDRIGAPDLLHADIDRILDAVRSC